VGDQIDTAAGDLNLPDARPAPEVPPLSYAAAESRKAEIMNDPALRQAILDENVDAVAEWRRITYALSRPPDTPTTPLAEAAQHLQQTSGQQLNDFQMQEIQENRPVSPQERHFALSKFEEFKNDADWFRRYQAGNMEARKQMALVQSILSRPVRDEQPR
jgi:hypothetical protein